MNGYTAVANAPDEFAAQMKREVTRWAKVIRAVGIQQIQ